MFTSYDSKAFIYAVVGIVDFALPVIEEKIGRPIRGVELATLILERNIGEGFNASVFEITADKAFPDYEEDARIEFSNFGNLFRSFIETRFGNSFGIDLTPNGLNLAVSYVYDFLPLEFR